ncbi:MAG: DUF4846 domain-containing protein [Bacteroidales bacterium]|nr:DUF4846 domain-containing protein [Bacteroidales bacterium]
MKTTVYIGLIFITSFLACGQDATQRQTVNQDTLSGYYNEPTQKDDGIINTDGQTLETRILTQSGFHRTVTEENSFTEYLRQLPLKPHGSEVALYDGKTKPNYDVYDAVVNLDIGKKDLHQCADAVMRLRAEYLWNQKQYDKIHFNFTNGFRVDYTEWMKGKRIVVKGNKTYWTQSGSASNTYQDFWKYMEIIFTYAGTLSLSKELKSVSIDDLKIGDVFIQGGSPGHAIMVVDLAVNPKTNEKIFLLAQSYMPAQEIQILKNPNDNKISPWYSINFRQKLRTPEWTFNKSDLKRFEE